MTVHCPTYAWAITGVAFALVAATMLVPPRQPMVVGLALVWAVGCVFRLERQCRAWARWTTNTPLTITMERLEQRPAKGLYFGEGFRWNAAYTQSLEEVIHTDGALPVAEDIQGGHPALHAVASGTQKNLIISHTELTGQVGIVGTNRSGKTRLLEVLSVDAVRAPGAVVMVDPKGDREWMLRVAHLAQRYGRPFHLITPVFPQRSARLNVLGTAATPAEVGARVRALMPNSQSGQGGDQFFTEFPLSVIERVAQAQKILGQPWTLEGLYGPCIVEDQKAALLLDYLHHLGYQGADNAKAAIGWYRKQCPHELLADGLITDYEAPRDYAMKVTGGLIPAFRGVIGDPLGPLFSAHDGGLTWPEIDREGMVVYIALGSLLFGDIANRIGRVLLQDLIGFLGHRYAYKDMTQAPPITVFVDELGDVVYPLFVNAINKGGGANARFIIAMQSLADPEAAIGKEQTRRILDNLNTRVWFRLADDWTAEQATNGLGPCQVILPDNGIGLSFGGVGGLSGSSQRRFAARESPLIRSTWLTALPRGHAFLRMRGEVWKLQVPLLPTLTPQEVASLGLTEMWESLDPEKLAQRKAPAAPQPAPDGVAEVP